jgi:hypothetical protein
MPELIEGATYRFIGDAIAYRGRTGVLSGVRRQGPQQFGMLSNHSEWIKAGLPPQIEVLARELELVSTPSENRKNLDKDHRNPLKKCQAAFDGEEQELVEAIRSEVIQHGYLVCVVGQRKAKGSGTTVGYPDMSFRRPEWLRGTACLIEIKNADGEMTREQKDLHKDGWSYEARSVAEVLEILESFEVAMKGSF